MRRGRLLESTPARVDAEIRTGSQQVSRFAYVGNPFYGQPLRDIRE
jgi:hypothetical protein